MKLNSLIIRTLDSFGAFKKVSDGGLIGQYSAQNSEDIERCSSKLTVVLDDGYEFHSYFTYSLGETPNCFLKLVEKCDRVLKPVISAISEMLYLRSFRS